MASLKLAQEELQKFQKCYKKHHDKKAKPRCLEVGDQVLILLLTDSNKLLMQWKGPYTVKSRVAAKEYSVKMEPKTKMYHVNRLKKYIAKEPKVDVVHSSNKYDATIAVAGVIYQDTDPSTGTLESTRLRGLSSVRPSTSPYGSPTFMVKKKAGCNRVCVDFRKLNKITEVGPEPMTTAEDLFRRLSGRNTCPKSM